MEIKKIEKVSKTYYEVYVATDGTEFASIDECEKYEKSAEGVLRARLKDIRVYEGNQESLFGIGSCECGVWVVVPKKKEDIDLVKQLALMHHNSDYAGWLTDEYIGKPVIVDFGYENEACYLDSFDHILKEAGLKFKVVEDNEK